MLHSFADAALFVGQLFLTSGQFLRLDFAGLSLGFAAGSLSCTAGCGFELSACIPVALPTTGQTACWDSTGAPISCTGTGHDGDTQTGAPFSFTDNGDGTITDNRTGLMWEKLSDDGSMGTTEKDWQAARERWKVADNPYRYYRW